MLYIYSNKRVAWLPEVDWLLLVLLFFASNKGWVFAGGGGGGGRYGTRVTKESRARR